MGGGNRICLGHLGATPRATQLIGPMGSWCLGPEMLEAMRATPCGIWGLPDLYLVVLGEPFGMRDRTQGLELHSFALSLRPRRLCDAD